MLHFKVFILSHSFHQDKLYPKRVKLDPQGMSPYMEKEPVPSPVRKKVSAWTEKVKKQQFSDVQGRITVTGKAPP